MADVALHAVARVPAGAQMTTVLEPHRSREEVPEASDRSVGLVFAGFFALVALLPLLHLGMPRWWALAVAAVFAALALVVPAWLHPLSVVWLGFGKLLHKVVSPAVMGAIFFVCVTPIAWVQRLRGSDGLALRRRPEAVSYWVARQPAQPAAETMKRQF